VVTDTLVPSFNGTYYEKHDLAREKEHNDRQRRRDLEGPRAKDEEKTLV